jgi:hypothetical protein
MAFARQLKHHGNERSHSWSAYCSWKYKENPAMSTFLAPIEKPKGLLMKLTCYFVRRQFGKVMTPIKVHQARLPAAFGRFYGKIAQLDKKLILSPEMRLFIR